MEELANEVVQSGTTSMIGGLYDCYTHFISLDENIFTLNIPNSYSVYMSKTAKEEDVFHWTKIDNEIFAVNMSRIAVCNGNTWDSTSMKNRYFQIIVGPKTESCAKVITTELDKILREYVVNMQ